MAEIIKGNYEGYIWKSDSPSPIVYYPAGAVDLSLDENVNPFIIEGELFDRNSGESISIRFVDGKYSVKRFNVASDINDPSKVTKKEYLAQRMPGIAKLEYLQYWDTVTDHYCEDMDTLQPGKLVFVGFKTDKE